MSWGGQKVRQSAPQLQAKKKQDAEALGHPDGEWGLDLQEAFMS